MFDDKQKIHPDPLHMPPYRRAQGILRWEIAAAEAAGCPVDDSYKRLAEQEPPEFTREDLGLD
jgi:hypothetical protein